MNMRMAVCTLSGIALLAACSSKSAPKPDTNVRFLQARSQQDVYEWRREICQAINTKWSISEAQYLTDRVAQIAAGVGILDDQLSDLKAIGTYRDAYWSIVESTGHNCKNWQPIVTSWLEQHRIPSP